MPKEKIVTPVDSVVQYVQEEIAQKRFLPGDRLPSERKLSEMLGVSRPHVRTALQRMETYGIVQTRPQSGTVVTEFTKKQIDGVVSETLKLEKYDFYSLVHVRVLLEIDACELAARNRTIEDIDRVERSLRELEECQDPKLRVEKDFAFHHELARSSHNPAIVDLLGIITPDIMRYYHKYRFCTVPERRVAAEHHEFLAKLKKQDDQGMRQLVLSHLDNQINFAKGQEK
ncbi:MAG: FadR family transcriptional regulator [Prevotella sp.]|nr:FadR family transcriptional regulator [Prevotella sp.]